MQSYQIRRNSDGNMLYFDAKELTDLCIENGILNGEKSKWVDIYHAESKSQPEQYPAGFYRHDYEHVIQTMMRDDNVIRLLLEELEKKHIPFTPSLDVNLLSVDLLQNSKNTCNTELQQAEYENPDFVPDCVKYKYDDIDIMIDFNDETAFGEPVAWLYFSDKTSLEICHEEYDVKPPFYSVRLHCSEEDFENGTYNKTCGVISSNVCNNFNQTMRTINDIVENKCKNNITLVYNTNIN